jgi:hypothetical protein
MDEGERWELELDRTGIINKTNCLHSYVPHTERMRLQRVGEGRKVIDRVQKIKYCKGGVKEGHIMGEKIYS